MQDDKPTYRITTETAAGLMTAHDDKNRSDATAHQFFTVTVARRNDKKVKGQIVAKAGDLITYRNCRCKVKKHRADPDNPRPAYNPRDKRLVWVWVDDAERTGYRSINLDDIREIRMGGVIYKVEG